MCWVMVRRLRDEAKMSEIELWGLLLNGEQPIDAIAVAWWIAGLQAGIDEPLNLNLDSSVTAWVRYLDDDERASLDGVGDDSPPA